MTNNSEWFQFLMRIYLSNEPNRSDTSEVCSYICSPDIVCQLVRMISQHLDATQRQIVIIVPLSLQLSELNSF